jgi:hypothetical protein
MAGFLGMKYEPFFLPNSPAEPEDVEELADVLEKVETLGRKLAEG